MGVHSQGPARRPHDRLFPSGGALSFGLVNNRLAGVYNEAALYRPTASSLLL